jgi:hypothetical protein
MMEKLKNAWSSVEERALQGRVSHVKSAKALAHRFAGCFANLGNSVMAAIPSGILTCRAP